MMCTVIWFAVKLDREKIQNPHIGCESTLAQLEENFRETENFTTSHNYHLSFESDRLLSLQGMAMTRR